MISVTQVNRDRVLIRTAAKLLRRLACRLERYGAHDVAASCSRTATSLASTLPAITVLA